MALVDNIVNTLPGMELLEEVSEKAWNHILPLL